MKSIIKFIARLAIVTVIILPVVVITIPIILYYYWKKPWEAIKLIPVTIIDEIVDLYSTCVYMGD